jgi:hypothetical protein
VEVSAVVLAIKFMERIHDAAFASFRDQTSRKTWKKHDCLRIAFSLRRLC